MSLFKCILILFILLQTQGCSHYYAQTKDLNERINEWLKNDEYSKIDSVLDVLTTDHPDYKAIKLKREKINVQKSIFIANTINNASKLVSDDKWQQAIDTYNISIRKLGDNKQIIAERDKLIKERNTQVHELRKNMLLRRSKALIQYAPIYNKLEKLIPEDYNARSDITRYNAETEEIATHLMNCGNQALENEDFSLAEECITLSNQLIPTADKQKLLSRTHSKRKFIDNKRRSRELIESFNDAYASGDFPKARYHLETLLALDPENKKALELKSQLDRNINSRIEKGITKGKSLYSQGKINQALEIWQELLSIDPKNEELTSLVARGKKVSKKIEKLEKAVQQ
ncbi:MAG: tetratricopeptide repeat protein [Gammaproteobacteria bacterium]|nr:tetratricopeptide repeat protein [Gammaproteobacteria bacterium]